MNEYIQISLAVCAVAAMGGVAVAQFRKGGRMEASELIKFYQAEAAGYKEMAEKTRREYTDKHEGLIKDIAGMKAELGAERKLREQYESILKDRNPETIKFMEFMIQATKDQSESNKEIARVLGEIHTYAKAEHDRDFKVTSTISKT